MKSPSNKQIELADKIANVLKIDFPRNDADFTAYAYYHFIKEHINDYSQYESSDDAEFDAEAFVMGLWEY